MEINNKMSKTLVVKFLKIAKQKIQRSNSWTQHSAKVYDDKQKRYQYCTIGAFTAAESTLAYEFGWPCAFGTYMDSLGHMRKQLASIGFEGDIIKFNDTKTHAEVMKLFDLAIENAGG